MSADYIETMIRRPKRLEEFERRYQRDAFRDITYEEALRIFTALWMEADRMDFGLDWREDLEADLAVARAVNGLPPRA